MTVRGNGRNCGCLRDRFFESECGAERWHSYANRRRVDPAASRGRSLEPNQWNQAFPGTNPAGRLLMGPLSEME